MNDNAENPTLSPFGDNSIKGFIKNNYGAELEALFLAEKQKGFEEGRKDAIASLNKDAELLKAEVEKFQNEVALFDQRKNDVEEKEQRATQRVEAFLTYVDHTEKALADLRKDARSDIIYVIANVFQSVYNTEERKNILLHAINQALDTLTDPSIEIQVSGSARSFVAQALSEVQEKSKVRVNDELSETQARIFADGICIHVSTDENRKKFKQNLLDAVNEI
ncbi:hypothetical protein [Enterovibrio norvegicus]|uniref:Flagellar assembly protein FliH/Type III secretion system HrpE domain-containing protein n=1 Tax=Enterovibrio norvegicus TaxID=188144 RepID=A0ABV4L4E5_9GAMM|nr:hypothetical protein [Enterovibrio norvegicus]OEF55555.1 hypothetical protein A1OU_24680 [Enterovibrio norvegicus]